MKSGVRWRSILVGLALLVFGAACLNYTTDAGAEHHREWAAAKGLPEPSQAIYFAGLGLNAIGAGFLGFLLGSRGARK